MSEVLSHLAKSQAIVLVDWAKQGGLLDRLLTGYAGHYILATGADETHVHFLNPARTGPQKMTHELFETCRKARGTD